LKALFALAVLAGPYVSYPQLRELKVTGRIPRTIR